MNDGYTHDIEVQFRDLDTRAHVNHAVYVSYLEQAKGRFMADVIGVSLSDVDTVVRRLEVDYRASVDPDETVSVTLTLADMGETSFVLEYEMAVDDEVVATGRTVSVLLGDDGGKRPLPEEWRTALESIR